MAHEHSKTLDKGRIRRQTGGEHDTGGGGHDQDHAAVSHGPGRRGGDNAASRTASPRERHARSGVREKEEKKAALFPKRDSHRPDERLRARPTAVRLSPWERAARVTRRPVVPRQSVGGRRGPIMEFTRDAQSRLIRELYRITRLCQHVVLTYPGTFPHRGDEAKTHLRAFCRSVKSLGIGGVWVMEFQQDRGAPHFHLLLNGWLNEAEARGQWLKVIGEPEALPASCGVEAEPIRNQYRIRSYVAKRPTKEAPCGFDAVGRFYSVFGPVSRIPTIDCVSETGVPLLIRALRTLDRKRRERRGWKRWRDSGRWSHSYGKWTNSELRAIRRLIAWANGQ